MSRTRELRCDTGARSGAVSALLLRPEACERLLVLGPGAGAGMRHAFLETLAERLAERRVATLRYQFPYAEAGRRRPDPRPVLVATVRAVVRTAAEMAEGMPLLAGGKSMGGRMTSLAASEAPLPGVRGLVFAGFPLHAAGRPSRERAAHLAEVPLPMLFLQGTRDRLADLDALRPVCRELGKRATLHVVPDADHSFRVPKRTGRRPEAVLEELAGKITEWSAALP